MNRYWDALIWPLLRTIEPRTVVEIGSEAGALTRPLAEICLRTGAELHAIDPSPRFDVEEWQERFAPSLIVHRERSLNALSRVPAPDAVVIDGDHNWFTVINELRILRRHTENAALPYPVVMLHDVGWPYGRRDLYYDPETIPDAHRLPFAKKGMDPAGGGLVDSAGLNAHLNNAIYENALENGVKTAIEDFIAESDIELEYREVTGFHGCGIVVARETLLANAALRRTVDELDGHAWLKKQTERLERARVSELIAGQGLRRQRDAGEREREALVAELERRAARIDQLEQSAARLAEDVRLLEQRAERSEAEKAVVRNALQVSERGAAAGRQLADELRRRLAGVQQERDQLAALAAEAGRVEAELVAARDALEASERRAESHAGHAKALLADLAAASEERRRLTAEVRGERQHADAVRARLADERVAAAEAKTLLDARVADLDRRSRELEAERTRALELKARSERLEEELAGVRRGYADVVGRLAAAEGERAVADRALAEQEHALAALRAEAERGADLDARLKATETALEARDEELKKAAYQERRLNRRLDERGLELRDIHAELRKRDEGLQHLGTALDGTRMELARVAASRSWRWGHAFFKFLRLLTLRPARSEDALARLQERLPRVPEPSASTSAGPPADAESTPPPRTVSSAAEQAEREHVATFATRIAALPPEAKQLLPPRSPRLLHGAVVDGRAAPTVDVVVCVHNALDDVRDCLAGLLEKTTYPFRLILVNDGSDAETTAFLRGVRDRVDGTRLIERTDPPHGYTLAANEGLHASAADYVALLNSDTIVSLGWLERLIEAGESDREVGVVGPLSNAASHQSVPTLRDNDDWAVNALPPWMTVDAMGLVVERLSSRRFPRFPFLNGFCYVIKRQVIDEIGVFDEATFPTGYCEENDFSLRASRAGFALAVADQAYVFHRKSRSYGHDGRRAIKKANYAAFREKHGASTVDPLVESLERDPALSEMRRTLTSAVRSPMALSDAFRDILGEPLRVTFVLPGLAAGSSGGAHSVYQEVSGMRRLGLDASVAIPTSSLERARAAYADADAVFQAWHDDADLASKTAESNVLVATHYKSVRMVASLCEGRPEVLPAYYIQDYEPWFATPGSAEADEAFASYSALPSGLLFAKTAWLCRLVGRHTGMHVTKVEPSIDREVFRPRSSKPEARPLRVVGMVRPRTPRRRPCATIRALAGLKHALGEGVEVAAFGCTDAEVSQLKLPEASVIEFYGLLTREQVATVLADADIFLDMSTYQAFGRTALEAMSCGCTALVPANGGAGEFVVHGENGLLIDTLDEQTAQTELISLVSDEARVRSFQERSLATAAQYSVIRAALSEYVLFDHHFRKRLGPGRARRGSHLRAVRL